MDISLYSIKSWLGLTIFVCQSFRLFKGILGFEDQMVEVEVFDIEEGEFDDAFVFRING